VNGKIYKSGYGVTEITFDSGDLGSATKVSATVKTKEGGVFSTNTQINPASVDLIWQSESYVPPFYKGKAMFSHENNITFIAIPHMESGGKEANVKNLIYKWTTNGEVIESASGYGKNTFTMTGSIISRPLEVEVDVTSPTNNQQAYSSLTVTPQDPSVIMYEVDPLYGIQFQKALLGSKELTTSEMSLIGLPLYFGVTDQRTSSLSYDWKINGVSTGNEKWDNSQTLRPKEGTSGASDVSLSISNSLKILQTAEVRFRVIFNNKPETNEL
jgi:hypothetical protein